MSSGFKDRGIFETFYPYCVLFVWVTYKRRDYELINHEVGRLLRSDSFNSRVKIESILEEDNKAIDFSKLNVNRSKERIVKKFEDSTSMLEYYKSKNKIRERIVKKYEENRSVLDDFKSKLS